MNALPTSPGRNGSLLSLLFLCLAIPAAACNSGSNRKAKTAPDPTQGWFTAFQEQFEHDGMVQWNGHRAGNPTGQYMDSSISVLTVGYNFAPRFTLDLELPFIQRSYRRPNGFAVEEGTVSGLGDASVVGRFKVWSEKRKVSNYAFSLAFGAQLPTGNTSRLREDLFDSSVPGAPRSGIHGDDLTLGSGSTDAIIGASWHQAAKRVSLDTALRYEICGTGAYGYRYADELDWSVAPGVVLSRTPFHQLGFSLAVTGDSKGKDTLKGVKLNDTAMTALFIGPQVRLDWHGNWSLSMAVDFPLFQHNTSFQAVESWDAAASLAWHF